MIKRTPRLDAFERQYGREAFRELSYAEALERFTALWVEARALNPDFGSNWQEDLEGDIALARALNGLPPATCLPHPPTRWAYASNSWNP